MANTNADPLGDCKWWAERLLSYTDQVVNLVFGLSIGVQALTFTLISDQRFCPRDARWWLLASQIVLLASSALGLGTILVRGLLYRDATEFRSQIDSSAAQMFKDRYIRWNKYSQVLVRIELTVFGIGFGLFLCMVVVGYWTAFALK